MKKVSVIFVFLFLFCLPFALLLAASVSMDSVPRVNTGDSFKVSIKASTHGEVINSIDFSLAYPKDLVSFVGYKEADSLVKMWIDAPHEEQGEIKMSGIIPGGISGLYDVNQDGLGGVPLVTLIFKAKLNGEANFRLTKSILLKNDGLGTNLLNTTSDLIISIENVLRIDRVTHPNVYLIPENVADINPPGNFVVNFIEPSIFSKTPLMVMFQANDSESGIKRYQIKIGDSDWADVQSPKSISRNLFPRTIAIRAYDFNDNYTDSKLEIPGSVSRIKLFLFIFLTVLCGILGYKLIK